MDGAKSLLSVAVPLFLALAIVLQIGGVVSLIIGYRVALMAFLLAGLTRIISLVMHDLWNLTPAVQHDHEMQNFIKNMGIMAGLMVVAGGSTDWKMPFLGGSA